MFKRKQRGFTIMEMLAAIFVISVGAMGVFNLVSQALSYINITSSRLVAIYLAQEGMEIARNIRDNNFLQINAGLIPDPEDQWTNNLSGCEAGCEADYTDPSLIQIVGSPRPLRIDGGFYNYSSGTATNFTRKITTSLVDLDDDTKYDRIEVSVEVKWQERGRTHQVNVQEHIYYWY
jgi:prepilin-type N-terminal cleavage/methylation domain-containing protein